MLERHNACEDDVCFVATAYMSPLISERGSRDFRILRNQLPQLASDFKFNLMRRLTVF